MATTAHTPIVIPARAPHPVASFAPPLVDPDVMRTLARFAIDAATQAGAQYADVRLVDQRQFQCTGSLADPRVLTFAYGYGLRVVVDGAVAFSGGGDPTPERLVRAARSAVATATGLAKIQDNVSRVRGAFASGPIVTGEWEASVEIDPFAVSPDDHLYALAGFAKLGETFRGPVGFGGIAVTWTAETRIFASSEGSLVTQRLHHAVPELSIMGISQDPSASNFERKMPVTSSVLTPSTAGFELVLGVPVRERVEQAMHDLIPWTTYPLSAVEVGRKDVVFDGQAFGALIGATVLPALSLDRVLGDEQDMSGTSFLAPLDTSVGHPLFAPSLSVSVVTGGTHFKRMQWDDEGVVPSARRVIERGTVVNYFTTRANVHVLADWYAKRGMPLQPQGIFRTDAVSGVPRAAPGACIVESPSQGPSLTDMVATIKDGVIVRGGQVAVDQQGLGGSVLNALVFEVRNGRITRRLKNAQIEFSTKGVLKSIPALGGPGTTDTMTNVLCGGMPVTCLPQTMTAPAAHVRSGNLTSTALRLT